MRYSAEGSSASWFRWSRRFLRVGLRVVGPGVLVLSGTLGQVGCGAGERISAGPVVRDSAGIMIVESSAPLLGESGVVRVSATPLLEIGVVEGEEAYQLNRVAGAVRLADGRIVVANGGSSELRYYDASGRHLRSVGGRGGGPGEFQHIRVLSRLAGDSLLVGDGGVARISIFDGEGGFVTSHGVPVPVGVLGDGTLVGRRSARTLAAGELKSGLLRDPEWVVGYARDGAVLDTLGLLRGTERHVHVEGSGGAISSIEISTPPFGRVQQLVSGGDRVYAGAADTYEIEVYRPGLGLERLIRLLRPHQAVTPAVIERLKEERLKEERLKEERLGAAASEERRRSVERLFAAMVFPEMLPAHGDFKVDAEGILWVEEYRSPGEEQPRWNLFDQERGWLTRVETPPRLRVLEIGADYLLGVWRDEFDVEYLRVYGISRSGLRR